MNKVIEYGILQEKIAEVRSVKEGYYTNFFMDAKRCEFLIQNALLYAIIKEGVVFILQKDGSFFHLYYCASALNKLECALGAALKEVNNTCVIDIVGQEHGLGDYQAIFRSVGFEDYCSLNRMSRNIEANVPFISDECVEIGNLDDVEIVYTLLQRYFDCYCEQLPSVREIEKWIISGHLLVCREKDVVVGFVLFDIIGVTSYLRYWFVHPDYRNKKIGSKLLHRFFYESRTTKRQLFWVIESNDNAIKRYVYYGFKPENMFDKVLIYRK